MAFPRRAQPKVGVTGSGRGSLLRAAIFPAFPSKEDASRTSVWSVSGMDWDERREDSWCPCSVDCRHHASFHLCSGVDWGGGCLCWEKGEPLSQFIAVFLKPVQFGPSVWFCPQRSIKISFFQYGYSVVLAPCVKKTILSTMLSHVTFTVRQIGTDIDIGIDISTCLSSICFWTPYSISLFIGLLWQYHTVVITVVL